MSKRWIGNGLLLLGAMIWGAAFVAQSVGMDYLEPFTFKAARCFLGSVVLLPTETVYGLVCRAEDRAAVNRIYALKDRDSTKPLAWFIADWRKLGHFGVRLEGLPTELAEKYCPGPITIIAPCMGGGTIGFRIPDHPFVTRRMASASLYR